MKQLFLFAFFIVGKLYLLQSQTNNKVTHPDTPGAQIPKIYLVYFKNGTPFDRDWARITNLPIKEEWMTEAGGKLNEFQSAWNQEGVKYLQTVFTEIHFPFPYLEMQATLTVSPVASTSAPLLVNVKPFLSSAEKPVPLSVFPIILFHELMHIYLRNLTDSSLLRKKYGKESFVTLNHLHLMALEKFVLVKLGKTEILQWLNSDYRTNKFTNFPPGYKRAWEIVNDIEGYEAFISELKLLTVDKSNR